MASDIKTDLAPYTDKWGLVHPTPGTISGNGLLFSAEAIAAYIANNQLTDNVKEDFIKAYAACEIQPGLYHRRPDGGFGQEQQDDYIGIAYMSRYLGHPEIAQRILDYGNKGVSELEMYPDNDSRTAYNILSIFGLFKIKNVYNNCEPGKFSLNAWFGRWPFLKVTLKFAANKNPNFLEKILWAIVQLSSMRADKNNHDNWILSWMAWKTVEGKSWITDFAGKIWLKKFREVHGDMGSLLKAYFVDQNQPIAVHLEGVY